MAITGLNSYVTAARQRIVINKTQNLTSASNAYHSATVLEAAGNPGAGVLAVGNTTSGVIFDDTLAGVPSIRSFGSGNTGYIQCASFRPDRFCSATLYDRIYGVGAITSAVATTTFSGQPDYSARVPGGYFGQVELWAEWATNPGIGSITATITYTDGAGTAGVVTPSFGLSGNVVSGRYTQVPLNSNGIRKIESINVTQASAGGSFNLVVVRRLAEFYAPLANVAHVLTWDDIGSNIVYDTSCLCVAVHQDGINAGTVAKFDLGLTIINA